MDMKNYTEQILDLLEEINTIPRKSGNRKPITDYFKKWSHSHGFSYKEDHVQNLLITVPASKGFENSPLVVIQGHTDMVCEKTTESDHDFTKDPIIHVREGDWLKAKDTSLGADNGIGLAMAMVAATDPGISHPELELLFTTDEEVGLWGADEIKPGFIQGKILINLDSEDLGIFTLGCAGAVISHIEFALSRENCPEHLTALTLNIGGFRGGHSGGDIQKNRGNATAELIRGLELLQKEIPFQIASLKGGSAMNAISRSAGALITIEKAYYEKVCSFWKTFGETIASENAKEEPNAFAGIEKTNLPERVFTLTATKEILSRLRLVPHGVQHMNAELPGQVETSLNFGVIDTVEAGVRITTMQRGSVKSRLHEITDRIETLASVLGGVYTLETFMDPWQPDWNSALVKKSRDLWKTLYGEDVELDVTHGALECGVIGNLSGGMDMISFGPDILDPHSPDERLRISSVGKTFDFLINLLASF
jgi:dipeptidase D